MVITATCPPTRDFLAFVSEFVHESVPPLLLALVAREH